MLTFVLSRFKDRTTEEFSQIEVEDNRLQVQLEDEFLEMIDDDLSCRVCGGTDREDVLLICDECGNGYAVKCSLNSLSSSSSFVFSYHTFCLELPSVPEAAEWMCPLCEVDQMSADEDLYDDSDLEEIQHILFDDSMNDDIEVGIYDKFDMKMSECCCFFV